MSIVIAEVDLDLANLAAQVAQSIVRLEIGGQGMGTGTIWHPLGLMVTNAHVASVGTLNARLENGALIKATLIGMNRVIDVAAFQLAVQHEVVAIPIGDAHTLRPGELIMAMGFPWGRGDGLTLGSFIGLSHLQGGFSRAPRVDWLAASLHLRPGHSGGPMFNTSGELVGLNTVMQGPDVGVAVPVNRAVESVKRILPRSMQSAIHA